MGVQSFYLAVGSLVPAARADAGVVVTQGLANPPARADALDLLESGASAEQALSKLLERSDRHSARQFGLIDAEGRIAHHTGGSCQGEARAITGACWLAIGNAARAGAIEAMAESLLTGAGAGVLARAYAALAAGERAGGDRRGRMSAGLKVVRSGGGFLDQGDVAADLRVDADPNPLRKLGELVSWHRLYRSDGGRSRTMIPLSSLGERERRALRAGLSRWLSRPIDEGEEGLLEALADFNLGDRIDRQAGTIDAALPGDAAFLNR